MTQLALVIDLNVCVGCHACVTSCKQWNTSGAAGYLSDDNPYGADPTGTFFNRVQTFEVGEFPNTETVHFPKSCLHCEDPPCVPVCPTGASYKRAEDGIVLVDYDKCIGCKYCSWACPYGAREIDAHQKVMKKCTLCVDRVEVGLEPACVKACPTGCLNFGTKDDMVALGNHRVEQLKANGFKDALLYDPQGVGGTSVVTVLPLGNPQLYGLPADPNVPVLVRVWKSFIRPIGVLAAFGAIIGSFMHYTKYGPKEPPDSDAGDRAA